MSGFLYFIPRSTTPSVQDARDAGLSHVFDAGRISTRHAFTHDAVGAPGYLVCEDKPDAARFIVDCKRQTWRRMPGSAAWIGYWTDDPPTPEDVRKTIVHGQDALKLADGRYWLIPKLRLPSEDDSNADTFRPAVPTYLELDVDGNETDGAVLPQFADAIEVAQRYFADRTTNEKESFSSTELNDAATAIIAVNYRVSKVELSIMRALTRDGSTARLILIYATDLVTYWTYAAGKEKKTESDATSDSDSG